MTMLVIVTIVAVGCTADAGDGQGSPADEVTASEPTAPTSAPEPASTPAPPTPTEATAVPTRQPPEPVPTPTGKPGSTITVRGTVSEGVEAGCLIMNEYLLIVDEPDYSNLVKVGARLEVTGYSDPTISSFCQQGIPFVVLAAVPITAPGQPTSPSGSG